MKLARPKRAKKEASRNFMGKISTQVKTSICKYTHVLRGEKEKVIYLYRHTAKGLRVKYYLM